MRWLISLSLIFTLILSGCGEDATVTKDNDFNPLTQIIVISEYPFIANKTTSQFTAIGNHSDLFTRDITSEVIWRSANTNIATINSSGLARAEGLGTVEISATLDGIIGLFFLTVTDAQISRIDVSPLTPKVSKGLTEQFEAVGTFDDASIQNITNAVIWSSTNPSVASIDNIDNVGQAEALLEGTTNITASFDGTPGTTQLTVTEAALVSIEINWPSFESPQLAGIKYAATGTFTDDTTSDITTQANWSSSNPLIATITPIGNFSYATGTAAGTLTIKATLGSLSDSGTLTITDQILDRILIEEVDPAVNTLETVTLTAIGVLDDNITAIDITEHAIWSTGDSDIATISNDLANPGEATGVSPGVTAVTIQSGDVAPFSTTLTVN